MRWELSPSRPLPCGVTILTTILQKEKPISQTEQAYQTIKEMILRGDIQQGEALSILMLCDRLGIGRTPVTAACQRLEYDGLIRVIPKQGVWVNTVPIDQAKEIYESRAAIEGYFARKAFEHFTSEDVAALKTLIEEQLAFGQQGDVYNYMLKDAEFHRYSMGKHPNGTLRELHTKLTERIFPFGMRNAASEARVQQAIREHRRIVRCIENQDGGAIVGAVEEHIMNSYIELTGVGRF